MLPCTGAWPLQLARPSPPCALHHHWRAVKLQLLQRQNCSTHTLRLHCHPHNASHGSGEHSLPGDVRLTGRVDSHTQLYCRTRQAVRCRAACSSCLPRQHSGAATPSYATCCRFTTNTATPSQALRYVFAAGTSPSPAALTVIHTGLAAALLASLAVLTGKRMTTTPVAPPAPLPTSQPLQRLLNWAAPSIQVAALELGALAAVANAITIVGFANSPATHGAFLFRLSAGLTPLLAVLAGDPVSPTVWVGLCLTKKRVPVLLKETRTSLAQNNAASLPQQPLPLYLTNPYLPCSHTP